MPWLGLWFHKPQVLDSTCLSLAAKLKLASSILFAGMHIEAGYTEQAYNMNSSSTVPTLAYMNACLKVHKCASVKPLHMLLSAWLYAAATACHLINIATCNTQL